MGEKQKEAKNMVHEMARWKTRVESELQSAANWEEQWGFLKAPKSGEEVEAELPTEKDTEGEAVGDRMAARLRYMRNRHKTPKEIFARPCTTAHSFGWYPSVELISSGNHGIRRNKELVAER
eukprot:GEMP01067763.1.p1 GENE.GEMP01067763.1~~GEMP01067763.1.p1  ORF type:complete len:122 (+),score=26.78 GEMP01067763.1:95-460(+)